MKAQVLFTAIILSYNAGVEVFAQQKYPQKNLLNHSPEIYKHLVRLINFQFDKKVLSSRTQRSYKAENTHGLADDHSRNYDDKKHDSDHKVMPNLDDKSLRYGECTELQCRLDVENYCGECSSHEIRMLQKLCRTVGKCYNDLYDFKMLLNGLKLLI